MSWFKVDDALHRSLKRLHVSTAAMGLWVCAGSWCRDMKTGGYVPRSALRVIVPDLSYDEACALAHELVESKTEGIHENGFWVTIANGWQFHGWELFQPEDEIEEKRRESISNARREAGLRGAQARWQKDGKNSFANDNDGKPRTRHVPARTCAHAPPPPPPTRSDPTFPVEINVSDPDQIQPDPSEPKDLTGNAREETKPADGSTGSEPTGNAVTGPDPEATGTSTGPFKSDDERDVFEYWATKLWPLAHRRGREPRATGPRLSRIRARLKAGYSPRDLKRVVWCVAKSPFHLGENDSGKCYIEPKTIFKNDETVDEWLTKVEGRINSKCDPERDRRLREADDREIDRLRRERDAKRSAHPPKSGSGDVSLPRSISAPPVDENALGANLEAFEKGAAGGR